MTFTEKSTITMTAVLLVVFSVYFALVLGQYATSSDRQAAFTGLTVAAVVVLAVLAAVSHIVLALAFRAQAVSSRDERDHLIALRSGRLGGYVLAVGVFASIVLAMADASAFWIGQVLLGAWVLAEVARGVAALVLYRRGA